MSLRVTINLLIIFSFEYIMCKERNLQNYNNLKCDSYSDCYNCTEENSFQCKWTNEDGCIIGQRTTR